ncbi:MAG TPA: hypothetical protein QF720_06425 [Nitrospinota bacterium]|jgi:uncharacterized protein YbaR (Trm112 family)|nr:hypothetical protein [Nitrospinota bacterium]
MNEVSENTITVVLCPHCKTNQEGVVGQENKCVNSTCGQKFTPNEEVPVIVHPQK